MCIRCQEHDAPEPLGLCAACAIQVRLELADGLRRLADYLGAWASFEDWLDSHGLGAA
jgi:hypothetical protein